MPRKPKSFVLFRLLCPFLAISAAAAEEIEIGPKEDWFAILNGSDLRPGDTVILKEGVYTDSRRLSLRHRGTREAPITIRGEEGKRIVFQRPDARQNTFNLEGAEFLTIHAIEITGGSAAVRINHPENEKVRGITLNRMHIHHIGGVAVTCNHPGNTYEEMHFSANHIHHTKGHGEAFYLGGNNDAEGKTTTVFRNSIVEGNYIHHLDGPTVSQGDGIEVKDGSYGNVIRNNIIHDTKYPGITIYGTDGKERNVVEGNTIWNTGDHGIQVAAEALVRRNLIMRTGGDGIRSQDHQSARVGHLDILENTILKPRGFGIRLDLSEGASGPVLIRNNEIAAPQAFRVADEEQISVQENRVSRLSSDTEVEQLQREALSSWRNVRR